MPTSSIPSPILIVVPTYNEAENIGSLIPAILESTKGFDVRVLVVDDDSTDGTARLVTEIAAAETRVKLLSRRGKLGLGTAYVAGFRYAMENGFALVVSMDADFSHSPSHLPALIEASAGAGVVVGSRYIKGGGVSNWPVHRKILSRVANALAHALLRVHARDCTSGYRAYRREILEQVDFNDIHSDGYSFLIELLTLCERRGVAVRETPIHFVDRRGGVSKISKIEIFKALATLWRLFWKRG